MEDNTYYAILMIKKRIDDDIYVFTPECVINGNFYLDVFVDEQYTEYLQFNDPSILQSEKDTVVGYVITEDELTEKYPELSISEAKSQYFNQILDTSHIGFYLRAEDRIIIVRTPLAHIFANLYDKLDIDDVIDWKDLNFNENDSLNQKIDLYGCDGVIVISCDEFEKLLNMKDSDQLKQKLENIYHLNEEVVNELYGLDQKQSTDDIEGTIMDIEQSKTEYLNLLFELKFEDKNPDYMKLIQKGYDLIEKLNQSMDDLGHDIFNFLQELCLDLKGKINENLKDEKEQLTILADTYGKLGHSLDIDYAKEKAFELKEKLVTLIKLYETSKQEEKTVLKKLDYSFNVRKIKEHFDSVIIGQEEAKKQVISAIIKNKMSDCNEKKSCLLIGPTGSGKTLITQTIGECFQIPIVIIDTTQLTVAGYIGANIEDFLRQLIVKANGDIKKAEEGLIVFDEIDKKGSENNSDISGKGVLNSLLSFFQGATYNVKYKDKNVSFDTSKLTIFATGAFTDVANSKESKAYKRTKIGFNATLEKKEDIVYQKLQIEDLVNYGHMPVELMGRFTTIVQLSGHTFESLKNILTDSRESTLVKQRELLQKLNVELIWTEEYLNAIARKALLLKTGARSLNPTVDDSLFEAFWEVFENIGEYQQIILTEESVLDNTMVQMIDQDGKSYLLKDMRNEKTYQKKL